MLSRQQKISIVAHALHVAGGASVGKNLIGSFCAANSQARYQLFVPQGIGYEQTVPAGVHCEWRSYEPRHGLIGRWIFDELVLMAHIRRFAPDFVLCLGNLGLRRPVGAQVLLIQDAHLFYPENHYGKVTLLERAYYSYRKLRLHRDLRRSFHVLCQTETARARIKSHYGYPRDITVLKNAVSPAVQTRRAAGASRGGRELAGRFRFFYLARYYPHKNFEILLELFKKYRQQLEGVVVYLTISADQHPGAKKFLEAVTRDSLASCIVNLGPLNQDEIAGYFDATSALLMPTLLESFSATYIEAMTLDRPIITSDFDFARDICRDAALYFDPRSVDSLFRALKTFMGDPQLGDALIERGRQVLSQQGATWQENSKKLHAICNNNN